MCRLAAFPPGYSKEDAISIMSVYGGGNQDGTGIAYVKDGELVVKKYPVSWERLVRDGVDVFAHMPYDGWTIAHVRAATHGEKTRANTHPFIKGDWAICHNGIFGGHRVAKALLTELGSSFEGETDSEVGAELISKFKPKRFPRFASDHDGTWLALNKNGELHVVVTGGACDLYKLKGTGGQMVVASSLTNDGVKTVEKGWLRFSPSGKLIGGDYTLEKSYRYTRYTPSYTNYGGHVSREDSKEYKAWEKQWDRKYGRQVRNNTVYNYNELSGRDIPPDWD